MRKDKELVFKLRQQGSSYRDIERATGVSRGTLAAWFRDISWSKHLSEEHRKKNHGASKERMERLNMTRKLSLQWKYALVEKEATEEYGTYRKDSLFWSGVMIYAGQGDKKNKNLVRISSSEVYIHKIFLHFLKKYLKIKDENIHFALLIHPDIEESVCKAYWSETLSIPLDLFHKTQVIKREGVVKRLQYGVGMSIISSTSLKKKLLKWLLLAKSEQFDTEAIIV